MTPDPLDLIARGNVWRQAARDVRRGPNDTAITVDTADLYTRGLIYALYPRSNPRTFVTP